MNIVIRGYELKQEVYSKGLFRVYFAEHSVLKNQTLRITVAEEELLNDADIKIAFNSAAFRLSFAEHNYIVKNIDLVEENGIFAILSENLVLRPFDLALNSATFDEKLLFVEKILEAIAYLNDRKIYHCSISPDNIYVDSELNPRIANYGLAEVFLSTKNHDLKERVLSGLDYLAPEIIKNSVNVNDRSEVYSCGKLLQYIFKTADDSGLPANLAAIINKSTAEIPVQRYRNIGDMLNDVKNYEQLSFKINNSIPGQGQTLNKSLLSGPEVEIPQHKAENHIYQQQNTFKSEPKPVFDFIQEIENQKKANAEKITNTNTYHPGQANRNPANSNSSNSQENYNRTREAIRNEASKQPAVKVKTNDVIIFGVLSIIFSFMLSLVGFVLAIIGLYRASANKKKVKSLERLFVPAESGPQTLGIVLSLIGMIISFSRMIMSLVS